MDISYQDLHRQIITTLDNISGNLERLNKTLSDHDKRLRYTEIEIARIKTRHQTSMRIWSLLAAACGVLGAVLVKFL